MRILNHPILGKDERENPITITVDDEKIKAYEGETIASAILASGKSVFRYTRKHRQPRGVYCAIGRCTDCVMTVDGIPNVRTCVELVRDGMIIETQHGLGKWSDQ